MKKIHLLLFFLLASLLSSCFLIPDQNLGNKVLNIDGQEVPLTSKRVVYINTTALAGQQNDPNAKCQATPLPDGCEILAETPKVAGKIVVIEIPQNIQEDIPLNPSRVLVNLGVQQQLEVIVPTTVSKESLPASFNLRHVLVELKFFDGKVDANHVLHNTADLEADAKANPNFVFTRSDRACEPMTEQVVEGVALHKCFYVTSGEGDGILRFSISDVAGLIKVLGKDSKPGATVTGTVALRFNNFQGGDFPLPFTIGETTINPAMSIRLSEGDTVISFR